MRCMSTLEEVEEEGFSGRALRRLSNRRALSPEVPFSVEGQKKQRIRLNLHRGELSLAGEMGGEFWLETGLGSEFSRFSGEGAANKHLTMQIAEQIFGIECAPNGCVYLTDGSLAYLSRRIDISPQGSLLVHDDFARLSERLENGAEKAASYEGLAQILEKFCGAYQVERWRLFRRIIFIYLVGDGQADARSFALLESTFSDRILAPAEDFMCTALHEPRAPRLRLELYLENEEPRDLKTYGFITGSDLIELGRRFGLSRQLATEAVDEFIGSEREIKSLINRSFLNASAKQAYLKIVDERRQALRI